MNYSFSEVRSPLELFHAGDSMRAFDFFGAHFTNQDGKSGVIFRVWAPNALSVSIVGNFNNWDKDSHYMYKIDDGDWELFVEGIEEFETYKYCIETPWNDRILKSDPYAFHSETRPDNASKVFDINKYSWNDDDWYESNSNIDTLKQPINIYEMHIGSWKRYQDGEFFDYRKLADELVPYLKEMNYTHIQLMPIMEYPFDPSWGYQPTGYFAATSRYGTPDGLMYLIDKLHQSGIGVFMDWVPSNFPKDDFGLAKFDGTSIYEHPNPKLGERPSWGTCLFNYAKKEVISFLVSSAVFWIDVFHIDGLRFGSLSSMLFLDYEKQDGEWEPNEYGSKVYIEAISFIKRTNVAIHMFNPDALTFAEENTSWAKITHKINEGGLGFDYKWNMGWTNDMLHYLSLEPKWRPFNHDNLTYSFFYAFSENFLLPISHDEVVHGKGSMIDKMPGDYNEKFAGLRAFFTYMYAHPGKKLIFMGTEIGQFDEWSCDGTIQWDLLEYDKHQQLKDFFRSLNGFYRENKPLYELDTIWKGFDWIHHDDFINSVIAFKRTDSEGNEIVAVCNFQPVKHDKYYIGVPKHGIYDEVFNSDLKEFGGTGVTNGSHIETVEMKIHGCDQGLCLSLPPMGVIYLKCTKEYKKEF